MPHYPNEIQYSDKYQDQYYQYRHVILTKQIAKKLPKGKLLNQQQWRQLGIQQSRGWSHYEIHKPQPHILLFRRPLGTDPQTGYPPKDFIPPSDQIW